jgi:hypothetical protein
MSARIDIQQGVYDSPEIQNKTKSEENKFAEQSKQQIVQ